MRKAPKKPTPPGKDAVHLIGIGGIGMSALAQWFLAEKWTVTGSDIVGTIITRDLQKRGVRVSIGQKTAHIPNGVSLVVRNQAILPKNPELLEAARRKIKTITYPEAIGRMTWWGYQTIAIAGSHGKSTTTALAALALIRAGLDPTIIVGTRIIELGNANFRRGRSDWLVLEADEYGRAFLHYAPLLTIITNIDADHLDTYGTLAGVKKGFLDFMSLTRRGGALILNRDDKNTMAMRKDIERIVKERSLRIAWFSLRDTDAKTIRTALRLPGEHNVRNSLAVLRLSEILKLPQKPVLDTLHSYEGSWRRMEYKGKFKVQSSKFKTYVDVFDDYGHHPSEISATLQAFREKFPRRELICVFQPHQAERLRSLWSEFQGAFKNADVSLIAPLYKVAGRDADHAKYSARELVRAIQKRHPKQRTFYIETLENIRQAVEKLILTLGEKRGSRRQVAGGRKRTGIAHLSPTTSHLSPIVIMMGAGDIVDYTDLLVGTQRSKRKRQN